MMAWLSVALFGGVVGLDTTSFPQVMVSRPVIAGTLTGALFGRPIEGLLIGFIMEAFDLVTLPIGAALYPEAGTATVSAAAAYMAVVPAGVDPATLVLAVAFGLLWEWLAGETVVLLRRSNGRLLARRGGLTANALERGHLTAMAIDYLRAATVAVTGGLIGYGLLLLVHGGWGLPEGLTVGALLLIVATVLGTPLALFGGGRVRRVSWGAGIAVGTALVFIL